MNKPILIKKELSKGSYNIYGNTNWLFVYNYFNNYTNSKIF